MRHLLPHLDAMRGVRVLVIGDVMLDEYHFGVVERVSPEAPVPVVSLRERTRQLGGAANVALNARQLGAEVRVVGLRGADADGEALVRLLGEHGLDSAGMVATATRRTTLKARVMAQGQQLLRVDTEDTHPASEREVEELWVAVRAQLGGGWPQVVVFEDYDKGTLGPELIARTLEAAQRAGIPTVVDPKRVNFWCYGGVTLFKPNLKEVREALPAVAVDPARLGTLDEADARLRERLGHGLSLITLGAAGAYLGDGRAPLREPAHVRAVADVCGAGDSVVAAAALALTVGAPPADVLALANLAGGLACEHLGVRPLTAGEVRGAVEESEREVVGGRQI